MPEEGSVFNAYSTAKQCMKNHVAYDMHIYAVFCITGEEPVLSPPTLLKKQGLFGENLPKYAKRFKRTGNCCARCILHKYSLLAYNSIIIKQHMGGILL